MKYWPHAPYHSFNEAGTYMVTGSTFNKELFFKKENELDLLHDLLLELAEKYQWKLEAWAIFPNHYHFLAQSSQDSASLRKFLRHLHSSSARALNKIHNTPGRTVWYQFWDSRITYQRSYLVRLNYVMQNPVRHKVVAPGEEYRWCSASWFAKNATKGYRETIMKIKCDDVNIIDDFEL
ncbi:MAG: transposase [Parachlamydiaceae bacterium]|nr:transposase [Parachlamydiaceae bacterium]